VHQSSVPHWGQITTYKHTYFVVFMGNHDPYKLDRSKPKERELYELFREVLAGNNQILIG
jgi:hypothetical protein